MTTIAEPLTFVRHPDPVVIDADEPAAISTDPRSTTRPSRIGAGISPSNCRLLIFREDTSVRCAKSSIVYLIRACYAESPVRAGSDTPSDASDRTMVIDEQREPTRWLIR